MFIFNQKPRLVEITEDYSGFFPQQLLTLEQQYYSLTHITASNDRLDDKAMALLQGAGLLLVLIGALRLPAFVTNPNLWGWLGLAVGFLAFAAMILLLTLSWYPGVSPSPGAQDWDNIYDRYITVDKDACFDQILVNVLESYDLKLSLNRVKARRLKWGVWLFLLQIVGLLILALTA